MATQAATMRYASRAAVQGSSAYDLSRTRRPEANNVRPKKPTPELERPESAPRRREHTQQAPSVAARPNAKNQKVYGISAFAVVGFAVAAVLMVFVLLAHVKYDEVTNETVQLQSQLSDLNEQERKLEIAYGNAFDVNTVEQYATHELGMSKPAQSQIGTVSVTAQDKAVVVSAPSDNSGKRESMLTFLLSLVAYFK
ncbi:hypothetical protein AAFA46_04140 [Oscillospiraceae bacterium WX1]